MPVDVFHFNCKHKVTDTACQEFCNPTRWSQLHTADNKWVFNSSAAEQTNVWFGAFHAIVRNMQADHYDFFLDEMILRRNRVTVKRLKEEHQEPYLVDRADWGL
jgi:hypothetical protein